MHKLTISLGNKNGPLSLLCFRGVLKRGECSMLSRLLVSIIVVVVISLVSPCQALVTPGDIYYHQAADSANAPIPVPGSDADLPLQINGTAGNVSGAHGDPIPLSDYYGDAHTVVLTNVRAGASGYFDLIQFNPNRTLNDDGTTVISQLQGVLLYFTVQLTKGRQVLDNETGNPVSQAIVTIGTSLRVWSPTSITGVDCMINPSVSNSGSLAPDTNGPYDGFPPGNLYTMTEAQLDNYSLGYADKLAAIINPSDPNSRAEVPNVIYLDTDPSHAGILAAFTGTGTVRFDYTSLLNTYHEASSQGVPGWTVSPRFDIEARVVYLYAAVPEPASMGLLAAAFLPMMARRIRKRKARRT